MSGRFFSQRCVWQGTCVPDGSVYTSIPAINSDLGAITEELRISNASTSIVGTQFSGNPRARERMISLPSQRPYAAQTGNRAVHWNSKGGSNHDVFLPRTCGDGLLFLDAHVGSIWKTLK